jgi:hypothetical protein
MGFVCINLPHKIWKLMPLMIGLHTTSWYVTCSCSGCPVSLRTPSSKVQVPPSS